MATDLAQRAREALLVDLLDSSGCHPTLLLDTQDLEVNIVGWGLDGIRVVAPGQHRLRDKVRIRFEHQGVEEGLVHMLTLVNSYVVSFPETGVETELCLRYRAAHTEASYDTLVDFLQDDLRLAELPIEDIHERPEGYFYKFPDAPGREVYPSQPDFMSDPAEETRRKEERTSVRVPLTYFLGDDRCEGTAYNVSLSGVYITSTDTLPVMNDEVKIFYPLPGAGLSEQVLIQGPVCWTAPAMGASGGGFCVKVGQLQDGENGEIWKGYVQGEPTVSGTIDVDFKGDKPVRPKAEA